MTRLDWVTNIPTPYRNHQFERMAAIFPRHDIALHVHFTAWTEPRRSWRFAPEDLHYPFTVHPPLVAALEQRGIHWNPSLLASLRRHPADVTLVGGWGSPTHALAAFALPAATVRVLASESHLGSQRRTHPIASAVKRAIITRYDAYLVTGASSRELICSLAPRAATRPFAVLPNVIDARLFRDGVAALRPDRASLRRALNVGDGHQLWLCPARLAPEKGLLQFLPSLAGLSEVTLLVAGDGPLRTRLEALVAERRLPVRFLGQQPEARMVELYAAADLFVLPSLSDPSPLSAVEAAAAGLPLLLSLRAGNCQDLVDEGRSGWALDPADPAGVRSLVHRIAALPLSALAAAGAAAALRYREAFDTDPCIERLAAFVVSLAERGPARTDSVR